MFCFQRSNVKSCCIWHFYLADHVSFTPHKEKIYKKIVKEMEKKNVTEKDEKANVFAVYLALITASHLWTGMHLTGNKYQCTCLKGQEGTLEPTYSSTLSNRITSGTIATHYLFMFEFQKPIKTFCISHKRQVEPNW